jgi:hypothetical protein
MSSISARISNPKSLFYPSLKSSFFEVYFKWIEINHSASFSLFLFALVSSCGYGCIFGGCFVVSRRVVGAMR